MSEWVKKKKNVQGAKIQKVNEYTIKSFPISLYLWSLNSLPQKQMLFFIYVVLQPMTTYTCA